MSGRGARERRRARRAAERAAKRAAKGGTPSPRPPAQGHPRLVYTQGPNDSTPISRSLSLQARILRLILRALVLLLVGLSAPVWLAYRVIVWVFSMLAGAFVWAWSSLPYAFPRR